MAIEEIEKVPQHDRFSRDAAARGMTGLYLCVLKISKKKINFPSKVWLSHIF